MVAKKDYNAPKHDDLDVPNLEVVKAMQSLTSKGYVKTQFSWQYYYYTLTNEGLEYLREWCAKSQLRLVGSKVLTICWNHVLGYTSPPKSFPQLTKRRLVPQDQLAADQEEMVHTARPVATATSTAAVMMAVRRTLVHLVATGRLTALDVVGQGSERILNGLSFLSSPVLFPFCWCHSNVLMYAICTAHYIGSIRPCYGSLSYFDIVKWPCSSTN